METYQEKSYDPAYYHGGVGYARNTERTGSVYSDDQKLLEAIKESPEYLEFQKQSDILKKKPELKARVDTFRADNYKVQNECDSDNLFEVVEQMGKESAELRRHPEVNAYLDAELALCKMMQRICIKLGEGIDIDVPGM